MQNSLEIINLSKNYPGFTLDNISFSVPKGSIVGLIGENGAGKSTTISASLGLISKNGGSVRFWGKDLKDSEDIKEDIGVVFDSINFHEKLNLCEVEKICRVAYKNWDKDRFSLLLEKFGLSQNSEIKSLSKGMKMKLSIAVALSHKAKLLILDEATSGLDPVMRDDLLDVFLDFVQDENNSILMSSHITSDLEKVADYICFIHKGKLLFFKSKDELRYNYGIIRCKKEQLEAVEKSDILAFRKEEYQINILVENKNAAKKKYPHLIVDDATIDEIMLMYVKGERAQ